MDNVSYHILECFDHSRFEIRCTFVTCRLNTHRFCIGGNLDEDSRGIGFRR